MLEKFQGPYGVFAGKDATRYFAKQIVSLDEDDGQPLTSEELVGMCFWSLEIAENMAFQTFQHYEV